MHDSNLSITELEEGIKCYFTFSFLAFQLFSKLGYLLVKKNTTDNLST